jgi:hypothetical protein
MPLLTDEQLQARQDRKELKNLALLADAVLIFLCNLDGAMKGPSTLERGQRRVAGEGKRSYPVFNTESRFQERR